MAPLQLQGHTLGEKHKQYNELVKNVTEQDPLQHISKINYNDPDLDNIFKIDVACSRKNVEYILDILKCEDMLYVSRAIKNSVWLITDEKYAHIVNPGYLHYQLFPQMSSKAINKFCLYIRLNLKTENRVEEFFNYYKNNNIKLALKWLPNCSLTLIKNATKIYANIINVTLLKRLCKKSIEVLQIYIKFTHEHKRNILEATTFLLNCHLEEYLDLMESLENHEYPVLGAKFTKIIMKNAPQKILDNFAKYADIIHLPTFVRFLKPENIIDFILQHQKSERLQNWFCRKTLKPFILVMRQENRSEFVKKILIDKKCDNQKQEEPTEICDYIPDLFAFCEDSYHWYKYVKFETAFMDLKKIIRAESSPSERISMLKVLLCSAGRKIDHVQVLLQYFRNKHMNEPVSFKRSFIISLLEQVQAFRFNETTWQILNEVFLSMGVYSESENNVQVFIKVAIIRKILSNDNIPDILEKKFSFETLKAYRKNLNEKESEKVFNFLYNFAMKEINKQMICSEFEFKIAINLLKNILILLSDWEKDLIKFPLLLDKIMEFIKKKNANCWDTNLSCLYNIRKTHRKYLFALSLELWPSQEACINALKHDPKILLASHNLLESLYSKDTINLKFFLNKIRMYWSNSLSSKCISFCLGQINCRRDNKALIRNIFLLLSQKALHDMVKKYVPEKEKINWNEHNELLLNIQKNIAKYIHIARPQPCLEIVLWYAKGDYLQFAIPSLTAILCNTSCVNTQNQIKCLIEAPVSLKKYAIRTAIDKLNNGEVTQMFSVIWKSTKNNSIRADVFKCTFKLMHKGENCSEIKIIWSLLNSFIDTLTEEENKEIYETLAKVNQVPLCVRVAFWKKGLQFLKTLPTKSIFKSIINRVIHSAEEFMDIVDVIFLAEILIENFKLNLQTESYNYKTLISGCVFADTNAESQYQNYRTIFLPLMELCVSSWHIKNGNKYVVRTKFYDLLECMCDGYKNIVIKQEIVTPDIIFNEIQDYLEQHLPVEENYTLLRGWKLACMVIKIISLNKSTKINDQIIDSHLMNSPRNNLFSILITQFIPLFVEELLQCLTQDMQSYYPSIYICFINAIKFMINLFRFDCLSQLLILKTILKSDLNESYVIVLNIIPSFVTDECQEKRNEILDMIHSHPSPEVKFHYYSYITKLYLKTI